jgi:hypothetical protein
VNKLALRNVAVVLLAALPAAMPGFAQNGFAQNGFAHRGKGAGEQETI